MTYRENWNNVFLFGPLDLVGHTWSLAVEEQFYLFWPLTLLLLVKKRPLVWIGIAIAAMIIAHFVFYKYGYSDNTLQYSLGIRPVGLLIGCIVAFLPISTGRLNSIIAPIALLAIFMLGAFADKSIYTHLLAPLAASLATGALIVCRGHMQA